MEKDELISAVAEATRFASNQNYPSGSLYVVATPLGNLCDITLRALHVMTLMDVIACEDTRQTSMLLKSFGIFGKRLVATHKHNEETAAMTIIGLLQQGLRVAYLCDAGTPGVSDPGGRLVRAIQSAGLKSIPIPGVSSITTLLSVAGITNSHQFVFLGFLSGKLAERKSAIDAIILDSRSTVLLEAPHRINDLAKMLSKLKLRPITIGRELTKQFEEVATIPADSMSSWLLSDSNRKRGEFSLVIHASPVKAEISESFRILNILMEDISLSLAAQLTAKITGESRKKLYEKALNIAASSRKFQANNPIQNI